MTKRIFKGNAPVNGIHLATFDGWKLYQRKGQPPFYNFKLVFDGEHPHKANFWFGYNATKRDIVRGSDSNALRTYAPSVYDRVLQWAQAHAL